MEIERKYLIANIPTNIQDYPHKRIQQGYISTHPVIRIRQLGEEYILTIKGKGLIAREEYELNITKEEFDVLSLKVDGLVIDKTRYYIPYNDYTIEFDIFHGELHGYVFAEVEFPSLEESSNFKAPTWFTQDVTGDGRYQNSQLSQGKKPPML